MREHEEKLEEDEVVVDSEEDEAISDDSDSLFAREMSNIDGCSGIDAINGGGKCINESRTDERESNGENYVGTEDPGECSQADAFDVIEHLVAMDDVEFLERDDSAKVVKENSPCVLTVKGVHTFARMIGLTRLVSHMGRFEWVDVILGKQLDDGNDGSGRKRTK